MFIKTSMYSMAIVACLLAMSTASFAHEKSEMKECMTMVHSSDVDADFIENMIAHHQMAIDMAKQELKDGNNAEARDMAKKIIDDQQAEIVNMQVWIKNHNKEGE